jgi:hypothetical protein
VGGLLSALILCAPQYGAVTQLTAPIDDASAKEAEFAALFFNAQDGCMIRTTLTELGHPQPVTTIQTDIMCAKVIVNDNVEQKRSQAIGMPFYLLDSRPSPTRTV